MNFPLTRVTHLRLSALRTKFSIISEHELQRSLNQARDQLTLLQHTHDNTQAKLIDHSQKYGELMDVREDRGEGGLVGDVRKAILFTHCIVPHLCADEEVVAKLAELDIVMMDLERANGKIVEVERKNVSSRL